MEPGTGLLMADGVGYVVWGMGKNHGGRMARRGTAMVL